MEANVGCMQQVAAWLGVACLGLLPLWPLSAQESKPRATLKGHTSSVCSVAFSPDGKALAAGSGPTIELATPGGKTPGSGSGAQTQSKDWRTP
jgi:hypothetical protein